MERWRFCIEQGDGWCDERMEGGQGESAVQFLPVKPVVAPGFLLVWI